MKRSVCKDCGQQIEQHGPEWWDAIGIGCTGRGEDGEVLMHRPAYLTLHVPGAPALVIMADRP